MNRSDFFKTLIGGAAVAAGAITSTTAKEIKVNPVLHDSSMPTIGINMFKSVEIFAHTRNVPSDDGWRKIEATGEKTFTFKGVSRFHLDDVRDACISKTPIRINFSGYGKSIIIVGRVSGVALADDRIDFVLEVDASDELRVL